ncbi:MAG: ChbG/HpnK family deacetylase [Methylovirgula sp.]
MVKDVQPTSARRRQTLRFCLCADDFGLSEAVSRGILSALAAGRLTATSAITTRPHWRTAARQLSALGASADIGLHLNLTLAAPLTPMPAFAPDGCLPGIGKVLRAAQRRSLPRAEISQEIAAQLDAFAEAFGRFPDFVDGHQHVHVLPDVRQVLFEVLEGKGLAGRLWLRDSGDRPWRILARKREIKKALGIAWLARRFAAEARAHGFAVNEGFSGFSDFSETRDCGADFARYLIAPGAAHLIMCHPGHVDDELSRLDPVTHSREKELAFLLSSRFNDRLARHGAELGRLEPIPITWNRSLSTSGISDVPKCDPRDGTNRLYIKELEHVPEKSINFSGTCSDAIFRYMIN